MKKISTILMLVVLVAIIGCSANTHVVGKGAQTGQTMETRQWYALFGAIPLNDVDTAAMAGETMDYEIVTEVSAMDIILNIFTGYVTVYSRTVTVTK